MTTKVVLIRHAQSLWNAAGRWQGHADPDLSEAGREQARLLAERLRHWPIDRIYTSDLKRAADTASAVARACGLEPVIDPVWRERHVGAWEGLTLDEIRVRYPDEWNAMPSGQVNAPGGEPQSDLYRRVSEAYRTLVSRHPGEMVVVVSHGGTIHSLVTYALGLPDTGHGAVTIRGNTGITVLEAGAVRTRVSLLNDTAHLGMLTPP
jgi:alpha-ribazole phosphatase